MAVFQHLKTHSHTELFKNGLACLFNDLDEEFIKNEVSHCKSPKPSAMSKINKKNREKREELKKKNQIPFSKGTYISPDAQENLDRLPEKFVRQGTNYTLPHFDEVKALFKAEWGDLD